MKEHLYNRPHPYIYSHLRSLQTYKVTSNTVMFYILYLHNMFDFVLCATVASFLYIDTSLSQDK